MAFQRGDQAVFWISEAISFAPVRVFFLVGLHFQFIFTTVALEQIGCVTARGPYYVVFEERDRLNKLFKQQEGFICLTMLATLLPFSPSLLLPSSTRPGAGDRHLIRRLHLG